MERERGIENHRDGETVRSNDNYPNRKLAKEHSDSAVLGKTQTSPRYPHQISLQLSSKFPEITQETIKIAHSRDN